MKTINKLVYANSLRIEETNVFINSSIDIFESYLNQGGGEDRPEIEMLSIQDENLSNYLNELKSYYNEFYSTLDVPIKLLETDELSIINKTRIRYVGDIKRIVMMQNKSNPSESSKILWNYLSAIKNLNKKSFIEVTGHISNLLKELKLDDMNQHCTNLKITTLIQKLTEEQNAFIALYKKRGYTIETRVINSYPSKVKCLKKYAEIINYTNSMVIYNVDTNYDDLIDNMNALVNPMNTIMRSRYSFKKKEDDRPEIE